MRKQAFVFQTGVTYSPILWVYRGTDPDNQMEAGIDYILAGPGDMDKTDATHYVDNTDSANPVVVAKTSLPTTINKVTVAADGVDEAVISGTPVDTQIRVAGGGTAQIFTGGGEDEEFSFLTPGTYEIRLLHELYLPQFYTIEAT